MIQDPTLIDNCPLVSFIITVYNLPADYIQECLRSILNLSLNAKEREIILVDDGCDQSPLADLQDVLDDIIYIRQRNMGPSEARNRGLCMATGKYIQFVDGDDYLIQAAYEHCLDIARYENPDIICFEMTNKEEETEVPFTYSKPVSGSTFMHDNNLHSAACCYLFKRAILLNLRYTPGILHEDEEFTPLLFLRADQVISTTSKAYFYRVRKGSRTHSQDIRHNLKRLADTERIIFHLQDVASSLPARDMAALNRRIAQLSMDYLYNTIILTKNYRHLEEAIGRLKARGLFPLPQKHYTRKYSLFCTAINNTLGRRLLFHTLCLTK